MSRYKKMVPEHTDPDTGLECPKSKKLLEKAFYLDANPKEIINVIIPGSIKRKKKRNWEQDETEAKAGVVPKEKTPLFLSRPESPT